MQPNFHILLFSKYSEKCTKLIENVQAISQSTPVNLFSQKNMIPICVDNEKVRKLVLKSNIISVKMVPCILVGYNSGEVEKYEGERAFQWVNVELSKLMQQVVPQQPKIQQPQQPQQQEMQPQQEIEEYEGPNEPVNEPVNKTPKKKKSKKREEPKQKSNKPKRPPMAIMTGQNNHEFIQPSEDDENENDRASDTRNAQRYVKSDTSVVSKKASVRDLAERFQRERESLDINNQQGGGNMINPVNMLNKQGDL